MIKNQHLLAAITAAGVLTVLVCVYLLMVENGNVRGLTSVNQEVADAKKNLQLLETRRLELVSELKTLENQQKTLESRAESADKWNKSKMALEKLASAHKGLLDQLQSEKSTREELQRDHLLLQKQVGQVIQNAKKIEDQLNRVEASLPKTTPKPASDKEKSKDPKKG